MPAALNAPVCQGDPIRVGEFSRATIAFLDSGIRLTIEQNTEFAVQPPRQPGRSFIDLFRGAILFFTRQPRSLDVRTPFVNAAVEGTEFLIRVDNDRAEVAVLEGTVAMVNDQGSLTLTSGQSGQALAEQAPSGSNVRPQDAVRWALYYEPILPPASLAELDQVPPASRDARYFVRRASELLAVGRVDEARAELARARALDPNDADATRCNAIIDVAQNNREGALENARRAVSLAPQSVSARMALSYALQASFNLEAARDELLQVVPQDPAQRSAGACARLGPSRGAMAGARLRQQGCGDGQQGGQLAPDLAHAHGAGICRVDAGQDLRREGIVRTRDCTGVQESARPAWSRPGEDPRGGSARRPARHRDRGGARRRRRGHPQLSRKGLFRGEARRVERRADRVSAKQLDPRDPTPYFYDAIRKQTINRPVEALHDLQTVHRAERQPRGLSIAIPPGLGFGCAKRKPGPNLSRPRL